MKNEPLTGYLLHARPYQEKRAIYYFFSLEHGIVHGVGGRGMPSFTLMECFATGSNTLKNFSQFYTKSTLPLIHFGKNQYALLYLNELLYKLIANENPCPALWHSYQHSITKLQQDPVLHNTKIILRAFEKVLFAELGVDIVWTMDNFGQLIDKTAFYEFIPSQGFVKADIGIVGQTLLDIHAKPHLEQHLTILGQIHRALIDFLLDYQPLNSRQLWKEQLRYG